MFNQPQCYGMKYISHPFVTSGCWPPIHSLLCSPNLRTNRQSHRPSPKYPVRFPLHHLRAPSRQEHQPLPQSTVRVLPSASYNGLSSTQPAHSHHAPLYFLVRQSKLLARRDELLLPFHCTVVQDYRGSVMDATSLSPAALVLQWPRIRRRRPWVQNDHRIKPHELFARRG